MELKQRLMTAELLSAIGSVTISNGRNKKKDIATVCCGLVYVESQFPLVHPYEGYKLDNPMTWDTFTHIYLLGKP